MDKTIESKKWLDKGVLIYGPRKGGTTLLENLHDGNNQLFVQSQEVKLKSFLTSLWSAQPQAKKTYLDYNLITEKTATNLDFKKYQESFSNLEKTTTLSELIKQDIYNLYDSAMWKPDDPKMWVIKEVGGHTQQILALWRMIMPFDAPIVMILRHPLMVVRSIINDRRKKRIRLSALDLLKETREASRVLIKQLDYLDDPNTYFVTYNELTESPETTMQNICTFLGVPYEDINAEPTIFGKNVIVSTSSKKSNKVFKSNKKWWQDLTLREKIFVKIFYIVFFKPHKISDNKKIQQIKTFEDVETLCKTRR